MKTFDWRSDFEQIIDLFQKGQGPFKIMSFFSDFTDSDVFPKSNSDFLGRFPDLPLSMVHFDQQKIVKEIYEGTYKTPLKAKTTLRSYHDASMLDLDFCKNMKCYEDLIPEFLVQTVAKSIDLTKLKPLVGAKHNPDYYYRFFYGFKGQETDPHFDWSAFNGVLFQLYGQREVIVFSPAAYPELEFASHYINLGWKDVIMRLTMHPTLFQKITLNPGEGLYIPPYFGHTVRYESDTAALSLRLLPQKLLARVHRYLPPNVLSAMVFDHFIRNDGAPPEFIEKLIKSKCYGDIVNIMEEKGREIFSKDFCLRQRSLTYEGYLFEQMRTFEHQLNEKERKLAIQKRGPAYFTTL